MPFWMPNSPRRTVEPQTLRRGLAPVFVRRFESIAKPITSVFAVPKKLTPGLRNRGAGAAGGEAPRVALNASRSKKNGSSRTPAHIRIPVPVMVRLMRPDAARPLGPVHVTVWPPFEARQVIVTCPPAAFSMNVRYSTASEKRELSDASGKYVLRMTVSVALFGFVKM